jgi:hypothetical protein
MTNMDHHFRRLRLEHLEDRVVPAVSPNFGDVTVPDAAALNSTTNLTNPVIGVAADGSYVVAWQYNDPVNHDSDIYARRFNADGTARGAAFAVANSVVDETQPAVAVAADGHFVVAYTRVVTSGSISRHSVFFQMFDASGSRTLGETEAPSHVDLTAPGFVAPNNFDDSSPDVSINSASGQFIIVWTQQTGAGNRDVYARAFQAGGNSLVLGDIPVATTTGDEFNPHVAARPTAANGFAGPFAAAISYTFNQGNGVQKVYFRRFDSSLAAIDTGPAGIPVSGFGTTAVEDQSALAMDTSGDVLLAWTATPNSGGASQVLYQEFNRVAAPLLTSPGFVAANSNLNESSPAVAINGDGRFLIAYVGSNPAGHVSPQTYFQEFNSPLSPVGVSRAVSSNSSPANESPHIASSANNQFVVVTEDMTGSSPEPVARGFAYLTSRVGVVRPTSGGGLVFSLDSNGNEKFDAHDSVFNFGLATDTVVIGDWNGDGTDKIGVVRATPGGGAVWSLDTNGDGVFDKGDSVFNFGLATDTLIIGDWNGDGRAKIGVVRAAPDGTAVFSLDTNGDGVFDKGDSVFHFGLATDKFVIGDWNGDGRAKIGVVRINSGQAVWSLDTNGNGVFDASDQVFTFGQSGDRFVVGDWNGAGKTEIGVVRTAMGQPTAQFILDTNGNGTMDTGDSSFTFGLANDLFIVGKWKPTPQ